MKKASRITVSAIANAINLATSVVHEIDGRQDNQDNKNVSSSRDAITRLVAARIQHNLFVNKKVA